MNPTSFTAHNIRLDDGSFTIPGKPELRDEVWCQAAVRTLRMVFPDGFEGRRIVDLGCLEGGYAVEFARLGFETLGIEVRASNMANCQWVKERVNLPNLEFVQDDVLNLEKYGHFDAVFCCGLLYHLDKPRSFIQMVARVCDHAALFQTHFALRNLTLNKFGLSELVLNEGLPGRWYPEHNLEPGDVLDTLKWNSWANRRSFWIEKPYLIQAINEAGFSTVFEQYDCLFPPLGDDITSGYYHTDTRNLFVGVKI